MLILQLNESVTPVAVHGSMEDSAAMKGQRFHHKIWIPDLSGG
jgi:hypothetical protein